MMDEELPVVGPSPPPPPPCPPTHSHHGRRLVVNRLAAREQSSVCTATRDMWERLFDEAYRADVIIHTHNGCQIYTHSNILSMATPVMKDMLKKPKGKDKRRCISIHGVPHDAVRVFIRFLYSSCYDPEEMEEFVLHLLVLSHVFVVPHLKKECERQLEKGLLTIDNVVDIFQLALLCNAPRLSLICHRMILRNLKPVATTDGWIAMKESHPVLEKEILQTVVEAGTRQKEFDQKRKEKKMYVQLYRAMEALVHICREGCRTIGPHDKVPKEDQPPCNYEACKGLEQLLRHFAACKLRVPGGCVHCKRMWQLLELHSRLCADSDVCRVPLCRNFKERSRKQNKKEEMRWKLLARKILRSNSISGAPFFSLTS